MRASSRARWHVAAGVLAQLRSAPGTTRAELAGRLGISSGSATEVTGRLRALHLVSEVPAPVQGRGRPTTVLAAHPDGPVVVAAELRQSEWRCAVAALDGSLEILAGDRHGSREPAAVIAALRAAVHAADRRFPGRVRAVSVAAAGTIRDGRLVQAAGLRWGQVELGAVAIDGVELLIGNDATLAGVAEARTGAAADTRCALHLIVEVGIGGALVVDGQPLRGATGAAGEFGHLPFGDPARRCPCGARGCWDLEVDGRAIARRLGAAPPADPRQYLRATLADPAARAAVTGVVGALGAGIAGLVNAHDPQVVTLGGLAGPLRAAAPEAFSAAYADGLMSSLRADPPPVLDALHGEEGALRGAAAVGLDRITTAAALAAWAAEQGEQQP